MIVIPEKKILIFTPPKCASTSLHKTLCQGETIYGHRIDGPQGDDEIDKHTTHVPYDYRTFRRYCVVRSPRERFNSLYRHFCREHFDVPYQDYVNMVSQGQLSWFYTWTLSKYAKNVHIDNLVPLDFLQEFLRAEIDSRIDLARENSYTYSSHITIPMYWAVLDVIKGVEHVGS